MATASFESHGKGQNNGGKGSVVTTAAVDMSSLSGFNNDHYINVTRALSATIKVAPGWYERTGTASNGDPVYAPANRHNV